MAVQPAVPNLWQYIRGEGQQQRSSQTGAESNEMCDAIGMGRVRG